MNPDMLRFVLDFSKSDPAAFEATLDAMLAEVKKQAMEVYTHRQKEAQCQWYSRGNATNN